MVNEMFRQFKDAMAPLLPKIAGEVIHKGKTLNKGTFNEGKEDLFNYTINL